MKSNSISTAGSSPTTQPSWPGSITTAWGAVNSTTQPSAYCMRMQPRPRPGAQIAPGPGPAPPATPPSPAFLARADFSFFGAWFITPDPRFTYDGHLTADLDLVDYGSGRANLLVDYEVVIGSEHRR